MEADNIEYFDHRREHARTDWDNGGLPRPEWEALLGETMRRADAAGHLRYALPESVGGRGGSNLDMACLLYTSDAADERSRVDLGGRRIIYKKKKKKRQTSHTPFTRYTTTNTELTSRRQKIQ